MYLIAEQNQADKLVREAAHATPTTTSPQRDVRLKPKQGLTDRFQLLEAGGGKQNILIAVRVREEKGGVWILEGSRWVKQCDVPNALPQYGVCFCAVADGLLAMCGQINEQASPVCCHYALSERRWRKLPDMITPKRYVKAVEISPMLVMVVGGYDDEGNCTNTCDILDMKLGDWSSVKQLPRHFKRLRVEVTDGRVFIMGQYGDDKAPNYELLEYHPSSDTYTTVQIDIPGSYGWEFWRSDMTAVAGKLYLVGDINTEYDFTTQHVTQLPNPITSDYGRCATVIGKSILLCGGRDKEYNAMEEYKTTTRQWKMMDVSLPFAFETGISFVANISV